MSYSAYAAIYKSCAKPQAAAANVLVALADPKRKDNILDLGCGPGHITKKLRAITDGRVVGMDCSEAMLKEAEENCADLSIEFVNQYAEDFQAANEFDLIFCNSVFHWLTDQKKVLKNSFRALRLGGVFALQTPISKDWCPQITSIIEEVGQNVFLKPIFKKYHSPWTYHNTLENYISLIEGQGFNVVFSEVQAIKKQNTFDEIVGIFNSGAASAYFDAANYDCSIDKKYIDHFMKLFKMRVKANLNNGTMETIFYRLFLIAKKLEA